MTPFYKRRKKMRLFEENCFPMSAAHVTTFTVFEDTGWIMKVIVTQIPGNSKESTVFSSIICFCQIPSVQMTASLFTRKWEPAGREGQCSDCNRYLLSWDLLYIVHGYSTKQWENILRRHLGVPQITAKNHFIKVYASFPTIIISFLEQCVMNNKLYVY